MDKSILIPFLLLVFGAIFLLSQVILVPTFGTKTKEKKLIRERLKEVTKMGHFEDVSLVRQKFLRELSPIERWLESLPGTEGLEDLLEQAGKTYPAYRVILAMAGLAVLFAVAAWFFSSYNIYITIPAFLLGGWIPLIKIQQDKKQRFELFEEQLPEALDLMSRALRSGYPFNEAMHYIADEMPDPIGHEFRITFDEINYGRDIKDAFNYMIIRVPSFNLIATTTAILIQRESGGNLAELLDKISDVLRKRFRFQRRVKTITAEGRMSAWVLSLLPFAVFLAISIGSPKYVKPLFTTDAGNIMLAVGLILQVLGAFWCRKLIDFDI